jgi:hypothetical protein
MPLPEPASSGLPESSVSSGQKSESSGTEPETRKNTFLAADPQLHTGDPQYSATKTRYTPNRQGVSHFLDPRRGSASTVH